MSTATIEHPRARSQPEPLWDRNDLALYFGVTVQTIRAWQKRGRLNGGVRIGNRWVWRPEEVVGLVQAAGRGA